MIYKFYGPPGTGKTYRLISRARAYLRIGTPIDKIAYFAFTKKAAKEAKERMPVEDSKLFYFRTIHSFAFEQLSLSEDKILQAEDYEKIGKALNIKVKYYDKYNKEEIHYLNCDSPYFQMVGRAINRDVSIREEYDRNEHNRKEIKWKLLKTIDDNLKEYKKVTGKLDFNDMITRLINKPDLPKFKVIFIDEAQDLSPLQWKLYDKLKEHADDIYLAGDDDQAIFAWAGADVDRFISEPAKEKVLKYSKRISISVQEQSQLPIENIKGLRKEKDYYPRDFEGITQRINNLDHVDLSEGQWYILTRTISRLNTIKDELRERNLYYQSNKGKSFAVRLYNASVNYNSWCRGKILDEKEIKDITEYTGVEIDKWNPEIDWFEAFKEANFDEREYIKNMIDNGEDLDQPARIWVSTIHAIKGGEKDNVILCLDLGHKIKKAIKKSEEKADEEHRVWYVGITRARNNLYKLKAKTKSNEYKIGANNE
jgi:DNA helicase-2/ATP-dependent DNA helicase PcrA